MKYKIEKNTVQETLVIPLNGRKMCSRLYPSLYRDETAIQLIDQLDYVFFRAGEEVRMSHAALLISGVRLAAERSGL